MKKLKILHIANVRFYNATMWYAFFLSKKLEELGHESKVLTLEGTLSDKKAKEFGISQISMPFNQKKLAQLPKIYKFIEEEIKNMRPDIVNCHRGELFPLFVYLKKKYGYKLVRTRGDQRPVKNNIFNNYFYTKASDAVIGTNSTIEKNFLENLKIEKSKVFSIVGGVDTDTFYEDKEKRIIARQEYNYSDTDCVLGLLGRLDPVKGHKEAIYALARAVEHGADNLKLCIIGFDEITKAKDFYALANELGVESRVHITGKVEDVNKVLNMCDIGFLPSIGSEAIARAALEFIACNVPLISSNVGVMPDLVLEEGRFKTAHIESMAQSLFTVSRALDAIRHKEYTEERSLLERVQSYQQELLKELSLEKFAQKSLEVYNSLV